jgi:hypothetical protein
MSNAAGLPQKKNQKSFRPTKFKLAVMDFMKFYFRIMMRKVISYKMVCYDLIFIFYKTLYSTMIDISRIMSIKIFLDHKAAFFSGVSYKAIT